MTIYDFDEIIDRRNSDSLKWNLYPEDVLPLWVADMDFRSPEPVIQALQQRVAHGVFGYSHMDPRAFKEVICARMQDRYQWTVTPEQIVMLPGLVTALSIVSLACAVPGEGVATLTPVYPPFFAAPAHRGVQLQTAPLTLQTEGNRLSYTLDIDALEACLTPATRFLLLCHPHNPIGRDFTPAEAQALADLALRHNLLICSDEIHLDLLLGGVQHRPFAMLAPSIGDRCITLLAPSKTFNVAGLNTALAIIPDPDLRRRVTQAGAEILPLPSVLGLTAAQAAYEHGQEWLDQLLPYLTLNRDLVTEFLGSRMPQLRATFPEATYLSWIDCRALGVADPTAFFREQARVALTDGAPFGAGGEGFVRLNFGCPRSRLLEALERMRRAVDQAA